MEPAEQFGHRLRDRMRDNRALWGSKAAIVDSGQTKPRDPEPWANWPDRERPPTLRFGVRDLLWAMSLLGIGLAGLIYVLQGNARPQYLAQWFFNLLVLCPAIGALIGAGIGALFQRKAIGALIGGLLGALAGFLSTGFSSLLT